MSFSSLGLVEVDIFEIENKLWRAEITTSHATDTVRYMVSCWWTLNRSNRTCHTNRYFNRVALKSPSVRRALVKHNLTKLNKY